MDAVNQMEQLLAVKKRRESRIRQRISQSEQQIQQIQRQQQQSMQRRGILRTSWQQANRQQHPVPQGKLYRLQQQLSDFYQQDQEITQQQQTLQQQLADTIAVRQQQQHLLRRNRVEQEKLTYVLEESL
ncbi:MAG: hypothetical protein AB2992_03960 [Candidatus Symbiodolus clandestinus]